MSKKSRFAERQETDRQANAWFDRIDDNIPFESFSSKEEQQQRGDEMMAEIRKRIRYYKFRNNWLSAAAAILLLIGGVSILIYNSSLETHNTQLVQQHNDVLPGSDKAILTLSNGKTISLSAVDSGQIVEKEGLKIEKTKTGEIVYHLNGSADMRTSAFNRIATPKGGQFRVTLPDGSKALLNAASSLTYPIHFSEKERRVKMTGEVYFEIAKATNNNNKRIPFFVETDKQEIQVLGTTFNVNAYANEAHQYTTLVEGSVRLRTTINKGESMLKPGQQAKIGNTIIVHDGNIKQDLAWVNGNFIFQREELQSILRKISRWYDLDIECPPDLAKMTFTGKVSRSQPLSAVIEMISATDKINVQLNGRRLIMKK